MQSSNNRKSKGRQLGGLIGWLVVCCTVATIGAMASIHAKEFYATLNQPSWAPPSWVFAPVWSTLYAMMALAIWRVWCIGRRPAVLAQLMFIAQLLVNGLWSWLFFKFHLGAIAFFEVLLLAILVGVTMVQCWRISSLAGWLLLPYFCWVVFAARLNWAMWQLNPQLLG